MRLLCLNEINTLSQKEHIKIFMKINHILQPFSAEKRINWALNNLEKKFVITSSFGIQSAVLLHLIISQNPKIPVIFIDTGYLFKETYLFLEELKEKLDINLYVFRSNKSPAWQEACYGKLWKQGIKGIKLYNKINKIEPMNKALKTLKVKTWFAGLRRTQSKSRKNLSILSIQKKIFKFLPIIDWDNKKIFSYIKKNNLKYHPLWEKGYCSVGDIHTSKPLETGMKEEETRFFGLKRECGLHEE
ncbi:phosphoadenylyl-sulfate reductase [Candidatus Tachikawaea gelatinosa]|nr:phosphoadenylyl-sulfate reductase [Candidatus Tachikawaea gelatinosa]